MITIKDKFSIQKMETAGKYISEILHTIAPLVKEGVTTAELDKWIEDQLKKNELISQTMGYHGYKHVSCISINDEVVHGVPHEKKRIKNGDLVKVDVCASWKGYCADMARCYVVGTQELKTKQLVAVAQQALDKGIEKAVPGNRLSDISAAIQDEVERHGFGVIRDFAGHGIGKKMHEDPEIVNYGKPGHGPVLKAGMAFAIEPMITLGSYKVYVDSDGWTVKTVDKSLAAHIEDTIIIMENGPHIITRFSGNERVI